jgi:hypothetical protein
LKKVRKMAETLEGVPFALSPALVHNKAPINYRTAEGSKIFKGAIAPLPIQFDSTSDNLQLFLDELRDRAFIYDWHDIILMKKQGMRDKRDLLDSYGEIS